MEKKIVTIDVGSEIVYCSFARTVYSIDLNNQVVNYYDNRHEIFVNLIERIKVHNQIVLINGIPVSEIEEVRIAGYNNKVTLKVGDIVALNERAKNDTTYAIASFMPPKEWEDVEGVIRELDEAINCWYVNGKKYHRDDIIIPTESHQCTPVEIKQSNTDSCVSEKSEPIENIEQFEEITKDNIKKVLDYNMIKFVLVASNGIRVQLANGDPLLQVYFENPKWLQLLELETGKLKRLPKFDFTKYLNEYIKQSQIDTILSTFTRYVNGQIQPFTTNKENADILIQVAKLAEGLENEKI